MSPENRGKAALVAVLTLLPLLLAWPLPRVLTTHLLAAPDQEAATHSWGLWAALHTRSPLVIRTPLLAFPDGVELVLVDPASLPWFALGLPLGPAAAYNLTFWAGLLLMGVAGALLAQRLAGSPALGAAVAMASPTLLGNAADGMSEGFGVGWVGIQLALLLRFRDSGRPRDGLLAALALAMACYAGPYNGVWALILDGAVGVAALIAARREGALRPLRLLAVGAFAALLVSPLLWAIETHRQDHLPGSLARAGLPPARNQPDIFRGGLQNGADLSDPWLPGPLTGGEAPVSHSAYLGLWVLAWALAAVLQDRRRWPWLLGAAAFSALSLGPRLYWLGEAVDLGGRSWLGPAGVAMLLVAPLQRLTRWYRAGAVASLLLAPLVASTAGRGRPALVVGLVAIADCLLLAPLAWPLHHSPLPDIGALARLPGPGALLELPPVTTATPPPGQWRDLLGLVQAQTGRPVGGSVMNLGVSPAARRGQAAVETLLREGSLPAGALDRTLADGFRWLAIYPAYRALPPAAQARLSACFGAPLEQSDTVWVFDLAQAPATGCPAPEDAAP